MASVERWIAVCALLFLVAPARAQEGAAPKAEAPSLVLITLSGVRRDHLGLYGYFRDTTPNLDALAAECLVFEHACTPMASPLPAHLSLLTAAYPHRHGIVDPLTVQKNPWRPTDQVRSAATLLRGAGFRTAAFVSARPVGSTTGIDAGFESFNGPNGFDVRAAPELTQLAGAWLEEHKSERFFLWLHYRGAWPPNQPPAECTKPLARGEKLDALIAARGIEPKRFDVGISKNSVLRMLFPEDPRRKGYEGMELPPVDLERFRSLYDRYDGDLRCADAELGVLIAHLRELGIWDRALVAIVSDSGYSLGQHDELEAGEVNAENLFVPWLLHVPSGLGPTPTRVARAVSLVDVLPTMLARFDNAVFAPLVAQGDGRDALAANYEREWALSQRQVHEKSNNDTGPVWALSSERWKYIWRPELSDKLYDLAADPHELHDVLATEPEIGAALKAELQAALGSAAGAKK